MSNSIQGLVLAFLAALAAATDLPPIPAAMVQVHDLAALNTQEAAQLEKQRALFRVVLHSSTEQADGLVSYECQGPANDIVYRTVWLHEDQDIADTMTVEAVMRIIPHRQDEQCEAFTEYRLTQAVAIVR